MEQLNYNQKSMNKKYPHGIRPAGRWLIFSGIIWFVIAVVICKSKLILGIVGEKLFPYALVFVPSAFGIGCMTFYNLFPKWLIIPIGIVGWILALSLLCWFTWFGRGATGT